MAALTLRRGVAVVFGMAAFAVVLVSAYDAMTRAVDDNAAGPALVGFVVALTPAIVASYVLVEALKQAIDGVPRTLHLIVGLVVAIVVVTTVPSLADSLSGFAD